jgi:hypothetical protein
MPFPFKRSLVKQALRHGAVVSSGLVIHFGIRVRDLTGLCAIQFELPYLPAFIPSSSTTPDVAKKNRQNFLTNAREVVRVTGGKGIIFSSGSGGGQAWHGMRGPADLINLSVTARMESSRSLDES